MQASGMSLDQVRSAIDWMVQKQSVMVATTQLFLVIAVIFIIGVMVIWLAPKPIRTVEAGAAH
jgi:MFS transporter, DHA2 family, multidrug resistance protein